MSAKFLEFLFEFPPNYAHTAPIWRRVLGAAVAKIAAAKISQGQPQPPVVRLLELGSGYGEHAVYLANVSRLGSIPLSETNPDKFPKEWLQAAKDQQQQQHQQDGDTVLPQLLWQPTEIPTTMTNIVKSWEKWQQLAPPSVSKCVLRPYVADLTESDVDTWATKTDVRYDVAMVINVFHICSESCVVRAFQGFAKALVPDGGIIVVYGPLKINGQYSGPNDEAFERNYLRAQGAYRDDSTSRPSDRGIRDLSFLQEAAGAVGFVLDSRVSMPEYNFVLVFKRQVKKG